MEKAEPFLVLSAFKMPHPPIETVHVNNKFSGPKMLCQKWESTNYANPQAFNFHKFGPSKKSVS